MGDVEHAKEEIPDIVDEGLAPDSRKTSIWAGSFSGESEIQGLCDGQGGNVIVI